MARTGEDNMFCSLGVITTDVIHLSEINKQFGYISGNRRLMEVADLLKSMFPNYRIYRYDEDEMLVLCINIKRQEMEQQVENLQKRLAGLGFGVAMGYSWSAHPQTRSQIAEAEVLMSNDKLKLMHGTTVMKRMEQSVIDEINDLMERGRYLVYLQPKVNMQTGKIIGSEALVRWQHPGKGLISPAAFVPVFEKNGFIIEIDKYMIRNTCAIIRRWIDSGIPVYPVSVNLSRLNLYNKRIIQDIREYVEEYQIPREYISFEITESAFSGDNSYIKILAEKLQKEHFKVLMDDFGSGYSSLNTLKEIPVDVLKIDLKFLPAGENDEKANLIIKHVVEMAVDLDLMIIVEGVEREEQVEFLTKIGCKIAQGFYYYRPISVLEYEAKVTQS